METMVKDDSFKTSEDEDVSYDDDLLEHGREVPFSEESSATGIGDGSASHTSGSTNHNGTTGDDQDNLVYFAKRENLRVRRLKCVIVFILFCVATGVSLAVYFSTANGQEDEFEAA
jgi:hypothetical protein